MTRDEMYDIREMLEGGSTIDSDTYYKYLRMVEQESQRQAGYVDILQVWDKRDKEMARRKRWSEEGLSYDEQQQLLYGFAIGSQSILNELTDTEEDLE